MRTRAEHLEWCKTRAIELVDAGDFQQAVTSMIADLQGHEETKNHKGIELTMLMMLTRRLSSRHEVKQFIDGFN